MDLKTKGQPSRTEASLKRKSPEAAYKAGVRLLTVRDRTSAELACRLAVKGFAQAESEAAVDRLKAEGYLDDRRFAGVWATGRIRTKPMGRLRLSKELETKGIEAQLAHEVLEEIYEGGEEPYARRAMAGKLAALGRRSGQSRTPQVARFLYRRGFSAEIIWRLLHETPQE